MAKGKFIDRFLKILNIAGDQINPATEESAAAITTALTDGSTQVAAADSPLIDAGGRQRISGLTTLLDIKHNHDKAPLFIDEEINGTGTSTHDATNSSVDYATAASADHVIRQTYQRTPYQNGKSMFILMSFADFEIQTNVTKRIGYFSSDTTGAFSTGFDGIFLESSGTISINVYKSGTATHSVDQEAWDDPLDGTGPSGITLDFEKIQVFALDFLWLGADRIRFYFKVDGKYVKFHEILNANNLLDVYMTSPNQPLRWELRQTGAGSGKFTEICSTVDTEGALNLTGKVLSCNLGVSTINANSTSSVYALIGIRLKSAQIDQSVDIIDFSVLPTTNDNQLIQIWLNPTVAGTFTYNAVSNSSVEVALGDTGGGASTTTVTGGTLLYSVNASSQVARELQILNSIRLGASLAGVRDTIVLTTRPFTSNSDVSGTISWRELA